MFCLKFKLPVIQIFTCTLNFNYKVPLETLLTLCKNEPDNIEYGR